MAFLEELPQVRRPAPGVELVCLSEPRFKRAYLDLHFDRPLDERAPARTLLTQVLDHGSRGHPSRRERIRALESLYGASVGMDGDRLGDAHRLTLEASWVGEDFLPPASRVTEGVLQMTRESLEDPLRGADGEPFPVETVQREREQLQRRIRSLQEDRSTYASERYLAVLCADEPHGRPPYGSEAEVERLRGADLERARLELIGSAPVTAVAVGPIDAERIDAALQDWFGSAGPHPDALREPPPAPILREPGTLREVQEHLAVDQARFFFGFRFTPPTDPQQLEALALANSLLGGGSHGRLFRVIREQRSLAYGIYSVLRTTKGILTVEAGIDAKAYAEVRDEVPAQMQALARGEFSEEELEMARSAALNDLRSLSDSAGALSRHLTREHYLGFLRSPATRAAMIKAVDREQVAACAAGWAPDLVYMLSAAEQTALAPATATPA